MEMGWAKKGPAGGMRWAAPADQESEAGLLALFSPFFSRICSNRFWRKEQKIWYHKFCKQATRNLEREREKEQETKGKECILL